MREITITKVEEVVNKYCVTCCISAYKQTDPRYYFEINFGGIIISLCEVCLANLHSHIEDNLTALGTSNE